MKGVGLLLILLGLVGGPAALAWVWWYFSPNQIRARRRRALLEESRETKEIERNLHVGDDY